LRSVKAEDDLAAANAKPQSGGKRTRTMQARCRAALCLFFVPLVLLTSGCRSNTGKLENELRTKDQLYREALEEQRRIESQNLHLRQELDATRNAGKKGAEAPSTFGVKRIVLGRATGGLDQDNVPGEEVLQVVLEPRDSEDHTFKAPGTVQIYALEVNPQGIKAPLCMWEIGPEKLEPAWKTGLLSTGYTFVLPWKVLPIYENVRIVVRFTTPDGRAFEADRDIKVRLVPGAIQKRADTSPPPEGLPLPRQAPMFDAGPILLPTTSTSSWRRSPGEPSTPQRSQWRPVAPAPAPTLAPAVSIGQLRPLESK
jgi:hypothetical protein